MPIYEYRCRKCGAELEALQKFSDAPLSQCKSCGGKLEKLISRSSFQLKGSGWYITDYKNKGKSDSSSSTSSSCAKPSSTSTSSTSSDSTSSESNK